MNKRNGQVMKQSKQDVAKQKQWNITCEPEPTIDRYHAIHQQAHHTVVPLV